MSYTYTPGARQDALSILRDKGLLDTPARPDPKPGTYLLDLHSHLRVADNGATSKVPPAYPQAAANDALPLGPLINWRALGWGLVVLLICAFLLGLLAVGK